MFNVRLVWLDKVEILSGLLLILGLTNLGGPSLVKKAQSHPYACGELQHGFEPSTRPFSGAVVGDRQLKP